MKNIFLLFIFILAANINVRAQKIESFKSQIEKHCGQAYEGYVAEGGRAGDGFTGERLVMQVLSCEANQIKIPFYAGNNKSRTWVLNFNEDSIQLKHEHKHEDGTDEEVTMYGGTSPNRGWENMQLFPADEETCTLIDYACHNVWWITADDTSFSYNLRRIGSDRRFSVVFDLTEPVVYNERPWGWKE